MSTITTFPPELLHEIFVHLRPSENDWTASWSKAQEVRQPLSACTLVSRFWYPVARAHLFHDIVYSFQSAPLTGEDIVGWPDPSCRWGTYHIEDLCARCSRLPIHRPHKTLQSFSDFLERSPVVQPSIHRLRLACYPSLRADDDIRPFGCYTFRGIPNYADIDLLPLEPFFRMLAHLPLLEYLQMWNIGFPDAYFTPPLFSSIREVEISYTRCRRITSLSVCQLLSCFADVRNIVWRGSNIYTSEHIDVSMLPPTLPLNVHTLFLSKIDCVPLLLNFFTLLSATPTSQNLRRVTLNYLPNYVLPDISTMLRVFGPHLESLTLTTTLSNLRPTINALDLSAFEDLQEFSIGLVLSLDSRERCREITKYFTQFFCSSGITPKRNPLLRKLTIYLGGVSRNSGWWRSLIQLTMDWSPVRSHIAAFESHIADIVRGFGLEGVYFELFADMPSKEIPLHVQVLREMAPRMFPYLSENNLFIVDKS